MQQPTMIPKRTILFIIFMWIVWSVLQTWGITQLGWPLETALIDTSVSTVLLIGIGLAVRNVLKYYRPGKGRFMQVFVWNFVIAGLWVGIVRWLLSLIIKDPGYYTFVTSSLPIRFFIGFLMTGWMALIHWVIFTFEENRENEKRIVDAEKLAKDAELYKLRQQLHPHFLFNSLNSISSLTGSKPEEARHMIQQLADFLRGTLKNDEKTIVTLEEELHYLGLYLDIEKVRFGHRLSTVIENTPECLKKRVPQMLLQPLVENAIKFGLYDTTDVVVIKVTAKAENGQLVVSIQNPFDPQTSQSRQGTGFGLSSIQRRLYLLYARKDLLETKTEGNLFTTTVKIPQHD